MYPLPAPPANRLIEIQSGLEYFQVGTDHIDSFTRFVFQHFARRIGRRQSWQPGEEDYRTMLAEERSLASTGYFMAARTGGGRIVGAMRAARWSPGMRLATEKIFHIDPAVLAHQWGIDPRGIWHVSQMCVDTEALVAKGYSWRTGATVMRNIVKHLFRAVAPHNGLMALLESDAQINFYLKKFLQIDATPLGRSREYIGQSHVAAIRLPDYYGLPYIQAAMGKRISR